MPEPKTKTVHERQIEIARKEKSKLVNGLIEKITTLALNSEKVKKKLLEVVCRGLDLYSLSLLEQVDRIGKTKLNLNNSNFKLTKDDIEALEGINDTQRLLLHQVLNNNIIRDNIQKLSTGSYELANILNFLQGVEDLNQYATHMTKFPEYDPDSFRKFQILNNYSYSLFTRTIYDETLHKNQNHLATTLNQYIQDLIDKINEDTSDSAPHVYEHDSLQYQDALVQNFMEAVKEVLKGSEKDHEKIVRAIQDKIPSLLQISNDSINEKQLKQSIHELLDT